MTQVDSLPFECQGTYGDAAYENNHRYQKHNFGFRAHKPPCIDDYADCH